MNKKNNLVFWSKSGTPLCVQSPSKPDDCDILMDEYKLDSNQNSDSVISVSIGGGFGKWIAGKSQDQINREAREYLLSTDWYIIRNQESGTPIPQDIIDARSAARLQVV